MRAGVSVSGRRICDLAQEAANAEDVEDALRTLAELRREVDEYERQQVVWALTAGRSYGDVARALGVTRQAAHRRFRDLAPPNLARRPRRARLPAGAEVRLVLGYARAEAMALRASGVEPDHVLLGLLRNGDRRAAAALAAAGVTLEDAREAARAAGPRRNGEAAGDGAQAALKRALAYAEAEGAPELGLDHLLRGLLAGMDGERPSLLGRLGVPPAAVLAALEPERPAPFAAAP